MRSKLQHINEYVVKYETKYCLKYPQEKHQQISIYTIFTGTALVPLVFKLLLLCSDEGE